MSSVIDDAAQRVLLEGRAELLEATLLRYRAVLNALKAFGWKTRIRRAAPILREVTKSEHEVEAALGIVARRAVSESWSPKSRVILCAKELTSLRAELEDALKRRLPGATGTLEAQLDRLKSEVLDVSRVVLPGERWATAADTLPFELPAVKAVSKWGVELEWLFGRPFQAAQKLPLTIDELRKAEAAWAEGEKSLDALWKRIEVVDASGSVTRMLRRRARRTPRSVAKNGPEVLLYAEFWRTLAAARLDEVLTARVSPVSILKHERFEVMAWLWAMERDEEAELQLPGARAALIELAYRLSTQRIPSGASAEWRRLHELAMQADFARDDADWSRVRDSVTLLLRVMESPRPSRSSSPLYRSLDQGPRQTKTAEVRADTLDGLVQQLQKLGVTSSRP